MEAEINNLNSEMRYDNNTYFPTIFFFLQMILPIRIESGNHVCPFCPKVMTKLSNMKVHIRSHTGEKPFQCPHCDYRTSVNSNLRKHINHKHCHLLSMN